MASLNYHSSDPQVLAEVERNFYSKFQNSPFKPIDGVTYQSVGITDKGASIFSSNLTVFGTSGFKWDSSDIAESHNRY